MFFVKQMQAVYTKKSQQSATSLHIEHYRFEGVVGSANCVATVDMAGGDGCDQRLYVYLSDNVNIGVETQRLHM